MKCAVSVKRKNVCQNSGLANANGVFGRSVGMSEFANDPSRPGNMARRVPRRIWTLRVIRKFVPIHKQGSSEYSNQSESAENI